MVLSRSKAKLYDPIRCNWVAATPEELVRQKLIYTMLHDLGFPKQLISIEKKISELPGVDMRSIDLKRRYDILCFIKDKATLAPLLLIECKEYHPDKKARLQAIGYNHFVKAPFVAVAGPNSTELIYPSYHNALPSYSELCEALCN